MRRRYAAAAGVLTAVFVVAGSYLWWHLQTRTASGVGPIGSIAVLPFVNSSGDQGTDYLADGITESLINNFSQLPNLRVMARTTVFRYKNKEVDAQAAGRELGVDGVLAGRVLQRGDALAIQADLVKVSDGSQLWGERFDRNWADVLAIQDEIATKIAERLRVRLSGDEQRLITKRFTESTEAYDLFLKGRYFYGKLTEGDLDKSIDYYRQAIAKDPNYALAYVGLAHSYLGLGGVTGFRSPRTTLPEGQTFAVKALELDPALADAHSALASYKLTYEWNWAEAEHELRRALDLNPNHAPAHHLYGTYYQTLGRFEAAIAERKTAQTLDPLSPLATANAGYPYYYARRYDEAIEHFHRALELEPNHSWSHLWIGQAYVQKQMHAEAIEAIQRAIELSGGDVRARATLGHAYGMAGNRPEARRILTGLKTLSTQKYVSPYFIALVYLGLNEDDQALALLEAAYQERHPYLIFMKVEPVFDRLRSNPRFVAIESRVGLTSIR